MEEIKPKIFEEKVCNSMADSMAEIADKIKEASRDIKENSNISYFIDEIKRIKKENCKVFVFGAGRSGLVGKAFAMRLMHLGYKSFFITETTTPGIQQRDLVIVISGSGQTELVINYVKIVLTKIGTKIFAITSKTDSILGRLVDQGCAIYVPGRKEENSIENYEESRLRGILPLVMGSQFEINSLVFLDCIVSQLMEILGVTEKDMQGIHAIE